ncbi:MAG: FkbM family methyltransferase [Pseudomonadota bacterium]
MTNQSSTADEQRLIEKHHHITKLKLLEIFPLFPFLRETEHINCIEIGANKGLWLEAYFEVFGERTSQYTAFEPVPVTFEQLQARVHRHISAHASKITTRQMCVGDSTDPVSIHFNAQNTTLASVVVTETHVGAKTVANDKSVDVQQTTGDALIAQAGGQTADIIKIDVEGYEWNVLQGLSASIASGKCPRIYFEFGQHQREVGQTFDQFYEFFSDHGYMLLKQQVGRNYFGFGHARRNDPELVERQSMHMLLATQVPPSTAYVGPRVTPLTAP